MPRAPCLARPRPYIPPPLCLPHRGPSALSPHPTPCLPSLAPSGPQATSDKDLRLIHVGLRPRSWKRPGAGLNHILIWHMRKLKLRDVKRLAQSHTGLQSQAGLLVLGLENQTFLTLPFLFPLRESKRDSCRMKDLLVVGFETLAPGGGLLPCTEDSSAVLNAGPGLGSSLDTLLGGSLNVGMAPETSRMCWVNVL